MSLPVEIESRRDAIASLLRENGADLVEILFRRAGSRAFVTFIVDKEGGISLEECARINQRLGIFFDSLSEDQAGGGAGFLGGPYFLEVNSPGLDRPLKTEKDFLKVVDRPVKLVYRAEDGRTLDEVGTLKSVQDGLLRLVRRRDGREIAVAIESVLKAVREIGFSR
jgi:ribosome maturation factor RimP